MEGLKFYLSSENLNNDELIIIKELIDFYASSRISINNLNRLEEQFKCIKNKLSVPFSESLTQKFKVVRKEKDLQKREKVLKLTYSLLFEEFESLNELVEKTGFNLRQIKEIYEISDEKYLLEDKVLVKAQEKIKKLEESRILEQQEKEIRSKLFKLYDEFLWFYLNSRYYASDIRKMTKVNPCDFLKNLEKEGLYDYYPADIEELIKNHIDCLTRLKVSRISNSIPIREVELIELLKPEVMKISVSDYNRLKVVADLFRNFGNIQKMVDTSIDIPNYNIAFSMLHLSDISILNSEAHQELDNYLMIEENYQNTFGREKENLVRQMVQKYYICNGNIIKLIEMEGQKEKVLRLLNDDLVRKIFGIKVSEEISTSLKEYSEKEYVIKTLKKVKTPEIVYL